MGKSNACAALPRAVARVSSAVDLRLSLAKHRCVNFMVQEVQGQKQQRVKPALLRYIPCMGKRQRQQGLSGQQVQRGLAA
jgi:hypothetical protein